MKFTIGQTLRLLAQTLEECGATWQVDGHKPDTNPDILARMPYTGPIYPATGYAVAAGPQQAFKLPSSESQRIDLNIILEAFQDKLEAIPNNAEYIGTWIEDGATIGAVLYVEASSYWELLTDAVCFAKATGQRAIYDFKNKAVIYV